MNLNVFIGSILIMVFIGYIYFSGFIFFYNDYSEDFEDYNETLYSENYTMESQTQSANNRIIIIFLGLIPLLSFAVFLILKLPKIIKGY